MSDRVYDPQIHKNYRRHKDPGSWGSPCPDAVTIPQAQALLDTGVLVTGAVYNVDGEMAYRALQHGTNLWHGHPIPWTALPNEARKQLITANRLSDSFWRKAIRKNLGAEYTP